MPVSVEEELPQPEQEQVFALQHRTVAMSTKRSRAEREREQEEDAGEAGDESPQLHDSKRSRTSVGAPKDWLLCPLLGNPVEGLPLVACKTPLDERFDVGEQYVVRVGSVVEFVRQFGGQEVGLWVNLASEGAYYDKDEVLDAGMEYAQIGSGEGCDEAIPSREEVRSFMRVAHKFVQKKAKGKVAMVHCTHGFNRTGFMFVAYLVEMMDFGVEDAISAFAEARSPGVFDKAFLQALCDRYQGDMEDVRVPQSPPAWVGSNEHGRSTPIAASLEELEQQRVAEATAERGTQLLGHSNEQSVHVHANGRLLVPPGCEWVEPGSKVHGEVLAHLGTLVGNANKVGGQSERSNSSNEDENGSSLFAEGHLMTEEECERVQSEDEVGKHLVTWAADGTRYLMLIAGGAVFLVGDLDVVLRVHGLPFPQRKRPAALVDNTVVQGMMVMDWDKSQGKHVHRFLMQDLVCFNSHAMSKEGLAVRLQCMKVELINVRKELAHKELLDMSKAPFSVRIMHYMKLREVGKLAQLLPSLPHSHDGLMVVDTRAAWHSGRNKAILVWREAQRTTVHFLVKLDGVDDEQRVVLKLYLRTSGEVGAQLHHHHTMAVGLDVIAQHDNLDGRVVAFNRTDAGGWSIVRVLEGVTAVAHTIEEAERDGCEFALVEA